MEDEEGAAAVAADGSITPSVADGAGEAAGEAAVDGGRLRGVAHAMRIDTISRMASYATTSSNGSADLSRPYTRRVATPRQNVCSRRAARRS